jgi:hypothetical protein
MNEDERIISLSQEALTRLGREGCTVVIVDNDITHLDEGGGFRVVPNWGVRATDKNDLSARINFETLPEESEEKIRAKLIDLFSGAAWK